MLSFFVESLIIAFVGGLVGCVAALPVNGLTTGTINWQTFSHLAFAFRVTPDLLALGMVFALLMGAVGGLPRHPRRAGQRGPHAAGAVATACPIPRDSDWTGPERLRLEPSRPIAECPRSAATRTGVPSSG